jgi:hypothetical protein
MLLLVKLNRQLNVILSSDALGQFAELSTNSFSGLQGKKLVLIKRGEDAEPMMGWKSEGATLPIRPIQFSGTRRDVAALDSSVIQVAETDDGAVYASKAAIAFNIGGTRNSIMVGPNIVYVGDDSVHTLLGLLEKPVPKHLLLSDPKMAMRMIRVVTERMLAYEVSTGLEQGLMLIDGSLKPSVFEPRGRPLKQLLWQCAANSTKVAAFTKGTKLKAIQRMESQLFDDDAYASFVEVTEHIKVFVSDLQGRSYLTRLTADGIPFRVDLPTDEDPDDVLSTVISSDVLVRGYPETLRAAHFLSIFTASEEAIVKSQLTRRAQVTILPSGNLRRTVLGTLSMSGRRTVS